ncbi:MAG TPA: serine/threonine-protein kinase, partial [Polyangiaceae bacterium]
LATDETRLRFDREAHVSSGESMAEPEDRDDVVPNVGETIRGKYVVEGDLAAGGMGAILSARDISTGEKVVVKVMLAAAMEIEGAITRFEREARAAAGILSEHVVRIFEVGELPNGAPYMVMEYLEGKDLGEIVGPDKPLPIDDAVDYVLQTCEAMAEAHKSGIVHRDLKPSNLFLAERGDGSKTIKVLDFGISKFSADSPVIGKEGASLTATRAMMGSPLYMSPEQVRSAKNVDRRSDIWSLGVILYELMSGRLPFEGDNAGAICAMIVADEPVPLKWMKQEVPSDLEAIVMKCLAKEPASRYQDVAELSTALRPFASKVGHRAAAQAVRTMENASGILPTLHAAPIKLDLGERAAAAPMAKTATVAATPSARRSPSSRPPPAGHVSSRPPPAGHVSSRPPPPHPAPAVPMMVPPKKPTNYGRRVIALALLGGIGWAGWTFRAPLTAKVHAATGDDLATPNGVVDAALSDPLVSTMPGEDGGEDAAMLAEFPDAAAYEELDANADADLDASDDEDDDDEEDDGGLLAQMRADGGTATHGVAHPHPHPTKPTKKKKRKR